MKTRPKTKPNRNWKIIPRTKRLTVFYFGNSEIRHFWYHSQDSWSTTFTVSGSISDPGNGSSCWLTIEGRQLQPVLPGQEALDFYSHKRKVGAPAPDPWHPQTAQEPQAIVTNPATSGPIIWQVIALMFCLTIRLSYAFFFPFFFSFQ